MKYIDDFRNRAAAQRLAEKIRRVAGDKEITLMEGGMRHSYHGYF